MRIVLQRRLGLPLSAAAVEAHSTWGEEEKEETVAATAAAAVVAAAVAVVSKVPTMPEVGDAAGHP